MPAIEASSSPTVSDVGATRTRILRQARAEFFTRGYSAFTMDGLAAELGMSKKTLYVHFTGKSEIIAAVIDDLAREIRTDAETIIHNRELDFAEKLRGFVEGMSERLSSLHPRTIRDLQRFAPALYAKVEEMRRKNVPYIFGRLVEEGQQTGLVRSDLPVDFAIEFFLQGVQGILQYQALERLKMAPSSVIATAIELFFGGLLTPAGRKHYEKLFPR